MAGSTKRGKFGFHSTGLKAGGDIRFNRFVKKGNSAGVVVEAGANDDVIGGVEIDTRLNLDGSAKTKFVQYSPVTVTLLGEVIIEVGSGGVTQFGYVKSGADGKAVAYTDPTISSSYTKSEVEAVRDAYKVIAGIALETVPENGFARILLK